MEFVHGGTVEEGDHGVAIVLAITDDHCPGTDYSVQGAGFDVRGERLVTGELEFDAASLLDLSLGRGAEVGLLLLDAPKSSEESFSSSLEVGGVATPLVTSVVVVDPSAFFLDERVVRLVLVVDGSAVLTPFKLALLVVVVAVVVDPLAVLRFTGVLRVDIPHEKRASPVVQARSLGVRVDSQSKKRSQSEKV